LLNCEPLLHHVPIKFVDESLVFAGTSIVSGFYERTAQFVHDMVSNGIQIQEVDDEGCFVDGASKDIGSEPLQILRSTKKPESGGDRRGSIDACRVDDIMARHPMHKKERETGRKDGTCSDSAGTDVALLFSHGTEQAQSPVNTLSLRRDIAEQFLYPSYRDIVVGSETGDKCKDLQIAAGAHVAIVNIPSSFRTGLQNINLMLQNHEFKCLVSSWACLAIVSNMVKSGKAGSGNKKPNVVMCYEIDLEGNGTEEEVHGDHADNPSPPSRPSRLSRAGSSFYEPRRVVLNRESSSTSYRRHLPGQRQPSLRLHGTQQVAAISDSRTQVHDQIQPPLFDSDPTSRAVQIDDDRLTQAVLTSESGSISGNETVVNSTPATTPPTLRLSKILVSDETTLAAVGGNAHTATKGGPAKVVANTAAVPAPNSSASNGDIRPTNSGKSSSRACFEHIFSEHERNLMLDADVDIEDCINNAVGELVAWGLTFDRKTWNFISKLSLHTIMESVCCGFYCESELRAAFKAITGETTLRDNDSANRKRLEELSVENLIDLFENSGLKNLIRAIVVRRIDGKQLVRRREDWPTIFGAEDLSGLHAHCSDWESRHILVLALDGR
jgi:hypothetical protein